MAQHRSAEKRYRQSLKRREQNKAWKTRVRKAVRRVQASAVAGKEDVVQQFRETERLLRKAGSKGVFHARTVSRTISRLHRIVHRPS
jgi:small subunit ribosomal protein S20